MKHKGVRADLVIPDINKIALNPEIFRACDIRGIVPESLSPPIAYLIGLAFGTMAKEAGQSRVVVGQDGRLSSPDLSQAVQQGLQDSGCHVYFIGQVPTPVLYFATHYLETGTGVMVTGSHNPANYNGFKLLLAGQVLSQEAIYALYERIQNNAFQKSQGQFTVCEMITPYIQKICSIITLEKKLKIVIDCGNGVAGVVAQRLFEALGCEVIPLFCEVDGNFPFHHPDPGQLENLEILSKTVRALQADLGLAFDGDGDRLGVISDQASIIWPDRVLMLFAQDLLKREPASNIVFDVKCSRHLSTLITQWGGQAIMYKTGHGWIKQKMKEVNARLAGEMSGHFFFKERWYGFDDACYAASRLLEIVAGQSSSVTQLFANFPQSVATPEINIPIPEDQKATFIEALCQSPVFAREHCVMIDGLRVEFEEGWGVVRASNTMSCLVLRFEAQSQVALKEIQILFQEAMLAIAPDLELGALFKIHTLAAYHTVE